MKGEAKAVFSILNPGVCFLCDGRVRCGNILTIGDNGERTFVFDTICGPCMITSEERIRKEMGIA